MVMPKTNHQSRDFFKSLNSFGRQNHETFWLATRFLDQKARHLALMALCLDGEFYRIVSSVQEEMVAQIRLQWWRDEVQRILSGQLSQQTLAAQSLEGLLKANPDFATEIEHLINAYDDIASGQQGDYAETLFRLLFAVAGAEQHDISKYAVLCSNVFQSANAGVLNRPAVEALARELDAVPEAIWPFLCLFEFTTDWQKKRRPSKLGQRFRLLLCFLGGEARLKTKLLRHAEAGN